MTQKNNTYTILYFLFISGKSWRRYRWVTLCLTRQ